MKTDVHPEYHEITFTCACGAQFKAGSTIKGDFKTEICSNCHPFFTGKQKLIDSSGRVDKFMAKMKKAKEQQGENTKTVKEKTVKKEDLIIESDSHEESEANEVTINEDKGKDKPKAKKTTEEETPTEEAEEKKAA
jgi:large subunit ribosomal protein L31